VPPKSGDSFRMTAYRCHHDRATRTAKGWTWSVMGNDNIHAGIKSMYVRLGLFDYGGLLAGRSNAGLTEPGQNAAHTLTQLAAIVCLSRTSLDDLVIGEMLKTLMDEIPRSFARAELRLRRDDKVFRSHKTV